MAQFMRYAVLLAALCSVAYGFTLVELITGLAATATPFSYNTMSLDEPNTKYFFSHEDDSGNVKFYSQLDALDVQIRGYDDNSNLITLAHFFALAPSYSECEEAAAEEPEEADDQSSSLLQPLGLFGKKALNSAACKAPASSILNADITAAGVFPLGGPAMVMSKLASGAYLRISTSSGKVITSAIASGDVFTLTKESVVSDAIATATIGAWSFIGDGTSGGIGGGSGGAESSQGNGTHWEDVISSTPIACPYGAYTTHTGTSNLALYAQVPATRPNAVEYGMGAATCYYSATPPVYIGSYARTMTQSKCSHVRFGESVRICTNFAPPVDGSTTSTGSATATGGK